MVLEDGPGRGVEGVFDIVANITDCDNDADTDGRKFMMQATQAGERVVEVLVGTEEVDVVKAENDYFIFGGKELAKPVAEGGQRYAACRNLSL